MMNGGFPPGMDPWAMYNANRTNASGGSIAQPTLSTTTGPAAQAAAAGATGCDASGRMPMGMPQQNFHPGFSIPTGTFGARNPAQAAYGLQNPGFTAAAFASALGHGQTAFQDRPAPKLSAFDLLGNARPNPSSGISMSPSTTPTTARDPNVLIAQALNQALTGEKKNIPTWNGNADTLRPWLKLLALWEYETHTPLDKRGIKLLQSFPENSQPRRIADTIPTEILLSAAGYSAILTALHEKYAPYLEASAPRAIDKFLFEGERAKGESFTSFIAAKQLARQEMEAQMGERISDRLCGRILLKQSCLNDLQREMLMLRGPILRGFDEVANLLRTLDRPEMLAKAQAGTVSRNFATYGTDERTEDQPDEELDEDEEWEEEESSSQDEQGKSFVYFEDRTFTENEAMEIMAYHSAYKDVRRELQKRKNERGFVKRGHDSGYKGRGKRPFKPTKGKGKSKFSKGTRYVKSSEDDLLARTRCFNCDELGHISRDCPFRDQPKKPASNSASPRKQFLMTSTGPQVFMHSSGYVAPDANEAAPSTSDLPQYRLMIFHAVQCRSHEALVDTAAEEAVIGHVAMERLEAELKKKNLKPIWQQGGPLPGAGGIGGAATVKGIAHVPIGVAGSNGVLQFTILQDGDEHRTPPLLPISWLESVGASIDCKHDLLSLEDGSSVNMRRLPTKHRAVSILDFSEDGWDLPRHLRRDPNVDPFVIPHQPATFQAALQQIAENMVISVWLLVDGNLHHLQDLPAEQRHSMVIPAECSAIQDPNTLEPERLTHAFLDGGRRIVVRDYWQDSQASRNLGDQTWHGAVVFASKQHRVVQADSRAQQPLAADAPIHSAFPSLNPSSGSTSSTPSCSNWANTARRAYFPSKQCSAAVSDVVGHAHEQLPDPPAVDPFVGSSLTLSCSPLPCSQELSATTAALPEQVPTDRVTFEFDLTRCDHDLPDCHDDSPTYDLRSNIISHKQILGRLASAFLPFVADDRDVRASWKPSQMLKKLFLTSAFWCPKRLHHDEPQSPAIMQGLGEERDESSRGTSSSQGVFSLATLGSGIAHDDGKYQEQHGHGILVQETSADAGSRGGRHQDQTSSQNQGSKQSGQTGHWKSTESFQGSNKVEQGSEGLHPRRGVSSSQGWEGSLLVHVPAMRRSLGETSSIPSIEFQPSGGRDNIVSQGLSNILATTQEPARPQDPEGDHQPIQLNANYLPRSDADCSKLKKVTWQDLREGGGTETGAKVQDSNGPKFIGGVLRAGGSGDGRRVHADPGANRRDQYGVPERQSGGNTWLRIRTGNSHGTRAHPGSLSLDDLEDYEVLQNHRNQSHDTTTSTTFKAELKHSSQIRDQSLASKVASVARMAAILLLTFSSTCDVTWNLQEIQTFVQVPNWLGLSQQTFFHTFQEDWMSAQPQQPDIRCKNLQACLVYPLNHCNNRLFAEDAEWMSKPTALPRGVKIFLEKSVFSHFGKDIVEVYSPPRATQEAELQNKKGHKPAWKIGQAFDLTQGYDLRDRQTRMEVLQHIRTWKPALVILSPPCTTFTALRNLTNYKRHPEVVQQEEQEGLLHWEFSLQIAEEQDDSHRAFLLEQPKDARSWKHPRAQRLRARSSVYEVTLDMCAFQLRTKDGDLAKKPTMLLTNCFPLVKLLHKRCSGDHRHQPLLGGRAAAAAQYTRPFVKAILHGLRRYLQFHGVCFTQPEVPASIEALPQALFHAVDCELQAWTQPLANYVHSEHSFQLEFQAFLTSQSHTAAHFPSNKILGGGSGRVSTLRRDPMPALDDAAVDDPVLENVSNQLRPLAEGPEVQQIAEAMREKTRKDGKLATSITADLRREIFRLHRNLGHPDPWTFLRALRHAQAKPEVIEWVRQEFKCPICESSRKPSLPRPGHLVRCLSFNEVVGIDVCFFEWKGRQHPLLNILCWGSGLQLIERLPNVDASATHHAFLRTWMMPFGPPSVLICDQGREFYGEDFSQRLMEQGVMVHFTDSHSPWQNSRTEKAGGIYKQKLAMVLDEVSAMTEHDFELCVKETCVARNRSFNRSGFSPYQRAFGVNPRMPASLLSDDLLNPELLQVSASSDVQRSWKVREAAATAWVKQQDIDAVRRSVKASTRKADLTPLSVGQWVFVWRSIPGFTGWSGPGVLLAISPSEKSLWVSLRGHLLKVSREHLRSATAEEHLGAELIKELSSEMLKDIKDGKVRHFHDLTEEPTPDQEKELQISIDPVEDEHSLQPVPEEPMPLSSVPEEDDLSMTPTTPVTTPRDMVIEVDDVPEIQHDPLDASTREPSAAASQLGPSAPPTMPPSRRSSIVVDEGNGGVLRAQFRPDRSAASSSARASPYPFSGNPPPLPPPPRSDGGDVNQAPSTFFEVADFDNTRSRHVNWTNGADGAVWWKDKRTGRSSMSALSNVGFHLDEAVGMFSFADACIYLTKAKTSPGQIVFTDLKPKHREVFEKARTKEVQSLLDNKAIKILSVEESREFRKQFPECVLPSRYVDRWKPNGDKFSVLPESFDQPGYEPMNDSGVSAKSRWCVVGWKDPLIHAIERSAPTPLSISLYMFFQLSATRRWSGKVKDAKTAFLQSLPTTRRKKLACSMPPDWTFPGCTAEQLILLETEVYGLVSGPAWWRKSLLMILTKELQYRINPYDRCILTLDDDSRGPDAKTQGIIVVEVDDVLECGGELHQQKMRTLEAKLRFGKAVDLKNEPEGTAYAGRRIKQLSDFSYEYSMDDYVANRLKPVLLEKKTLLKHAKTTLLSATEEAQLRGTIASLNWTAREGRPDAAAAASILAGCFPSPSVQDALDTNKVVQKIKAHSVRLKIHSIPEENVRHVIIADSAFDPTGKTKPQHGWLQAITDQRLNQGLEAPISLLSWKSRRLRRKAGNTMLCESISLSTALGALEKQIAMWDSIRISRYDVRQRNEANDDHGLRGTPTVLASDDPGYADPLSLAIVDAKSVYDAAASEQASGEDDRSALEIAIIQDSISKCKGRVRWIPHNKNPADMLTKLSQAHEVPMMELLKKCRLKIQAEEETLAEGRQHEFRKKTKVNPKDFSGADITCNS